MIIGRRKLESGFLIAWDQLVFDDWCYHESLYTCVYRKGPSNMPVRRSGIAFFSFSGGGSIQCSNRVKLFQGSYSCVVISTFYVWTYTHTCIPYMYVYEIILNIVYWGLFLAFSSWFLINIYVFYGFLTELCNFFPSGFCLAPYFLYLVFVFSAWNRRKVLAFYSSTTKCLSIFGTLSI